MSGIHTSTTCSLEEPSLQASDIQSRSELQRNLTSAPSAKLNKTVGDSLAAQRRSTTHSVEHFVVVRPPPVSEASCRVNLQVQLVLSRSAARDDHLIATHSEEPGLVRRTCSVTSSSTVASNVSICSCQHSPHWRTRRRIRPLYNLRLLKKGAFTVTDAGTDKSVAFSWKGQVELQDSQRPNAVELCFAPAQVDQDQGQTLSTRFSNSGQQQGIARQKAIKAYLSAIRRRHTDNNVATSLSELDTSTKPIRKYCWNVQDLSRPGDQERRSDGLGSNETLTSMWENRIAGRGDDVHLQTYDSPIQFEWIRRLVSRRPDETAWSCYAVINSRTRIPLGSLSCISNHPGLVGHLTITFPLPDLSQSSLATDIAGLTREELKDVIVITSLFIILNEAKSTII